LPEIVQNQAIIGRDDMVAFGFLAGGVAVGKSVARILVPRFENGKGVATAKGAPWVMLGTAWVFSTKLMIRGKAVAIYERDTLNYFLTFWLRGCGDAEVKTTQPVRWRLKSTRFWYDLDRAPDIRFM
jgi:hypothetical protein